MTHPAQPFASRHIGPSEAEIRTMLDSLGQASLQSLIDTVVPASIRTAPKLELGPALSEHELLDALRAMADDNPAFRSFQGAGYHETLTPPVILRNILEDPGWYTAYTPYQAEIAQGRLEMLLNWQTAVSDLTGLDVANASVLDEATAAAEAMALCARLRPRGSEAAVFRVDDRCHPQTLAVVRTRAEALGFALETGRYEDWTWRPADQGRVFGCLVQSPDTRGRLHDVTELCAAAQPAQAKVVVASDLLALTLVTPPGEQGADVVVGSAQRLGVPMGWGGPHAGFFATREAYKRQAPGRIIGLSKDAQGGRGLRMALQTREQHIRRDRATSNICTAQVLLAVIAGAYSIWHGPEGLTAIAEHVRSLAEGLADALAKLGHDVEPGPRFDTVTVRPSGRSAAVVLDAARDRGMNLRDHGDGTVGVTFGEPATGDDLAGILEAFGGQSPRIAAPAPLPEGIRRTSPFLTHEVFHQHRSESQLLRYLTRLRNKDLSLAHSMIPLGSCTMKLNAAAEMIPITWPGFSNPHPFAPREQVAGYHRLLDDLEAKLTAITGFAAMSMQPNAGSQGEYAGLLVIRAWHEARGEESRDVCLIPTSAHGTNPASAVMAGMKVVAVRCDDGGDIDIADLEAKAAEHADRLSALMVTYPSTHGVFEEAIKEICEIVHAHGGQVYMDGANLNAMVGVSRPADLGADVCHLNLHKTFCIPHGGGGPGMGPIGVQAHLAPFLPGHPLVDCGGALHSEPRPIGAISAAPFGSPSILPISWAYIAMMGGEGLTEATAVAILNANYVARRLDAHFPVLYKGRSGFVAHECIIDLRPLKATSGVTVDDVAKRLMDFGFHAPTMSWPVAGTMMIEPTESEDLAELDRFCEAMIQIREEIARVESGQWPRDDNPLHHSPHTAAVVTADDWDRAYTRTEAAYPLPWVRERKFWPAVGRVDNAFGDRNLVCACPSVEDLAEA